MRREAMKLPVRKQINKEIGELLKPIYFAEIPLYGLFDAVDNHGYTVVDEEGNPWTGFLCGHQGDAHFDIVHKVLKTPMRNRLYMQWYRMPSGRYEVLAYVA